MTAFSSPKALPDRAKPAFRALAAAMIGIGLAVAGFHVVADWEDRRAGRRFEALAQDNAHILQHGVDDYIERLVGLRGLFHGAADGNVSRRGFETFARELMHDLPGLLNLSWAPLVRHADREALERSARADGIAGYRISGIDAKGNKSGPQDARADYYPVFYSTRPYDAPVYGIDLQDGGVRQQPLDKARDHDVVATTQNFRLQSGRGNGYEFYAVLPVYRPGAPYGTLEERRTNIMGFVRSTLQFHMMVDAALSDVQTEVSTLVYETQAHGTDLPIYSRSNGAMSDERIPLADINAQKLKWTGSLHIADRSWNVVIVPGGALNARHNSAWIVLGAGLMVTLIVAGYVWTSARYVRMLEEANSLILEQALTDPLTGLANRRAFVERLTETFDAAGRTGDCFAVHFIDLDGFKEINDHHGHPMGDALLREVAHRIRTHVRKTDVAARFGGDEFAVVQSLVASPSAAHLFAEKLVEALGARYMIDGAELRVTASLGIALRTSQSEGPNGLMMQADLALYGAKAAGRNCVRMHGSGSGETSEAEALQSSAA